MNLDACVRDLLIAGADDWVNIPEVAWIAKSVGGANTLDEIREASLQIIREVVSKGLMIAGDVLVDAGFRRWELTPAESIARIEREWRAFGRKPDMGDICWLANTDEGNKQAKLLEQNQQQK